MSKKIYYYKCENTGQKTNVTFSGDKNFISGLSTFFSITLQDAIKSFTDLLHGINVHDFELQLVGQQKKQGSVNGGEGSKFKTFKKHRKKKYFSDKNKV